MAISADDAREVAAGTEAGRVVGDAANPSTFRLAAGTPVGRGAALTAEPAAAPAGGAGATAGAYDTAANRDAMIVTLNDTRTRLGELEARMQALGLIA